MAELYLRQSCLFHQSTPDIRSTGLVVAMFSGLIASGPFMRKGLADIKLVFLGAVPILFGGFVGSLSAITLSEQFGATWTLLYACFWVLFWA